MEIFQDDPGEERMNRSNPSTLRRCSGRDHSASSWQAGRVNRVFRMMYPERKAHHAVPLQRKRKKKREYWIPTYSSNYSEYAFAGMTNKKRMIDY